ASPPASPAKSRKRSSSTPSEAQGRSAKASAAALRSCAQLIADSIPPCRALELVAPQPAIDRNDRPGDVVGERRGEEHGEDREILGLAIGADRDVLGGEF